MMVDGPYELEPADPAHELVAGMDGVTDVRDLVDERLGDLDGDLGKLLW